MERLLARLERRFGRYAPGNLTYGLIAAQLVGLVLGLTAPEKIGLLYFDADRILAGEVWRVATWLAIPPSVGRGDGVSLFFALFTLYVLHWMGTTLESEWGAFKFFVFWLMGVLGTIIAASVSGGETSNTLFLLTFFLAFATLWPDFPIRPIFFLPFTVKIKWLAYISAAYVVQTTFSRHGLEKLLPIVMVGNYLLFFHQTLLDRVRGFVRQAERAGARNRLRAERSAVELPRSRRCAICGASNDDPEVEIRVCDCEKCGGVRRDLCLPHVRNH